MRSYDICPISKLIFSRRTSISQLLLKHCLKKDVIATFKDLEKEEADTIRAKISRTLQNPKHFKDNLSNNEHRALRE